ncbi:hypothetical protein B0H13DRAFT_1023950, partial [Mycena leptocephala]
MDNVSFSHPSSTQRLGTRKLTGTPMTALAADRARVDGQPAWHERLNSYESPILALPNEIISEIFIFFLPIYPRCPPLTGLLSPTLLTRICRRWREIALGTPELWRAISLSDCEDISIENQVRISDIWLTRSGCCPLSVQMDEGEDGYAVNESVLAAVTPHSARWEHLKLHISAWHLRTLDRAASMSLLRHLDLTLDTPSPAFLEFHEVPMLRTVILNDHAAAVVELPWPQLTSLTLGHVFPHQCVPILQQTPDLVHCDLCLFPVFDETDDLPDITLPRLESLTLKERHNNATGIVGFLEIFIVPGLRRLQITEELL